MLWLPSVRKSAQRNNSHSAQFVRPHHGVRRESVMIHTLLDMKPVAVNIEVAWQIPSL
jgi:hypothetical protein